MDGGLISSWFIKVDHRWLSHESALQETSRSFLKTTDLFIVSQRYEPPWSQSANFCNCLGIYYYITTVHNKYNGSIRKCDGISIFDVITVTCTLSYIGLVLDWICVKIISRLLVLNWIWGKFPEFLALDWIMCYIRTKMVLTGCWRQSFNNAVILEVKLCALS